MRSLQTTLTRIFIVLESVSHGLSENWYGISRKARKFKRFFPPKSGGLQKKKKVFTEFETDFSAEIANSNIFSTQIQVVSLKKKKKKVFTEFETDFSAEIANSNVFSAQIQVVFKKKKVFTEFETDCSAQIGNPNVWGGAIFLWGDYFQLFTKNWPQNHQKGAILHTSQANGGGGGSSPPAPLATLLATTVINSGIFILYIYLFTVLLFNFRSNIHFYKINLISA